MSIGGSNGENTQPMKISKEDKLRLVIWFAISLFCFGISLISVPMGIITFSLFLLLIFGTALYLKVEQESNDEQE